MTGLSARDGTDVQPDGERRPIPVAVSIVIAFNDPKKAATFLASAASCADLDSCEFILVSDGCGSPVLSPFRGVRTTVIEVAKSGHIGYLRNAGVSRARGDHLYFVDCDCEFQADTLSRVLASRAEGLVTKGRIIFFGKSLASCVDALIREKRYSVDPHFPYCPNLLISKALFISLGQFDPSFQYGSDGEFATRVRELGVPVRFDESMVIRHDCENSAKGIFMKWVCYGEGRYARIRKRPERALSNPWFPPLFDRGLGWHYNVAVCLCNVARAFGMSKAWFQAMMRRLPALGAGVRPS